jgi:DNA-binding response OmpR family regulator
MAQRYNLLVIDDEQPILDEIKSYFEKRDFKVETALSGAEGLEKLHNEEFDVALIDLCMPEKGGIDVIKEIHEDSIPVSFAVLTAHGERDEAITALKLGAEDWFQKGAFTMEELYISVKRLAQVIPEEKFDEFMAVLNEKR